MDNTPGGHSSPLYSGGDGSSPEQAIVINADSTVMGILAEYEYLSNMYGQPDTEFAVLYQRLVRIDLNFYDVLHIRIANREEKDIFFNINQFFGK